MPLPEIKEPQRQQAWAAFQVMFCGGVAGTVFFLLLRNLAIHFLQRSLQPDWFYTANLFLRYGYLIWFVAYFFIANLQIQTEGRLLWESRDIFFTVVQSVLVFAAAVDLGFVDQKPHDHFGPYVLPNLAILLISTLAYGLFRRGRWADVNRVRAALAVCSGMALIVCAVAGKVLSGFVLFLLFVILFLLFMTLYWYGRIRIATFPA
jgi:hypothetical protein